MGLERPQIVPEGEPLRPPVSEGAESHGAFKQRDPELAALCTSVIGAVREGLVPYQVQEELFQAMNPSVQRDVIARESGLDASVLATFKQQLYLVDNILRQVFTEDGQVKADPEVLGIKPKDALTMSTNLSKLMVKELPKIYNMDRIQRMEQALYTVMSRRMDREQQDEFIEELEKQQNQI